MNELAREPALLVWQEGDLIKDQWVLDRTSLTIGRAPECDVRLAVGLTHTRADPVGGESLSVGRRGEQERRFRQPSAGDQTSAIRRR